MNRQTLFVWLRRGCAVCRAAIFPRYWSKCGAGRNTRDEVDNGGWRSGNLRPICSTSGGSFKVLIERHRAITAVVRAHQYRRLSRASSGCSPVSD